MTRWLNAAQEAQTLVTELTKLTESPKLGPDAQENRVLSVKSVLSERTKPKHQTPPIASDASQYGPGCGGLQRTWTGKVVNLDEWQNLSEWDKHGSTGKVWNGLTQKWEAKP